MTTPTVRISSAADLITAIPYILGYAPEDSIVIFATKGGQFVLGARLDLCPENVTFPGLRTALQKAAPSGAWVVSYETSGTVSAHPMARAIGAVVQEYVDHCDGIVIERDGSWKATTGETGILCQDDGLGVAAEFVAAGAAPLPSRSVVEQSYEAGPLSEQVTPLIEEADTSEEAYLAAWQQALGAAWPQAESVATLVAAAEKHLAIRDAVYMHISGDDQLSDVLPKLELPEMEMWRDGANRLRALASALPDHPGSADVLAVIGAFEMNRAGDGSRARFAVERALRLNPRHRLSAIILTALDKGIRLI